MPTAIKACLEGICLYDELSNREDLVWVIEPLNSKEHPADVKVTVSDRVAWIESVLTDEFILARNAFVKYGPAWMVRGLERFKSRGMAA